MITIIIISTILFLALLITSFLINFYRDPERKIPKGNNIVAPADGTVISIINTSKANIKIKNTKIQRAIIDEIIVPHVMPYVTEK